MTRWREFLKKEFGLLLAFLSSSELGSGSGSAGDGVVVVLLFSSEAVEFWAISSTFIEFCVCGFGSSGGLSCRSLTSMGWYSLLLSLFVMDTSVVVLAMLFVVTVELVDECSVVAAVVSGGLREEACHLHARTSARKVNEAAL